MKSSLASSPLGSLIKGRPAHAGSASSGIARRIAFGLWGLPLVLSLAPAVAPAWAAPAPASAAAASSQPPSSSSSATSSATSSAEPQLVSHGQFTDVEVYRPRTAIKDFVLLLSDADKLTSTERQLAHTMTAAGAMVAAVPLPPFYRRAEMSQTQCVYAGGDFENLARYVQAFDKLPTYIAPMVVGAGSGAAFAYVLLAQAPAGTFSGVLTLNFCPRVDLKTPPCASNALRWQASADGKGFDLQPGGPLGAPWTALQTAAASPTCPAAEAQAFVAKLPPATWVPASASTTGASGAPPAPASAGNLPSNFESSYVKLAAQRVPLGMPPAQLANLPIVETAVENTGISAGKRFAVIVSGDGGWAGIDKGIAAALVKQGVPVAGLDSLRYFWSARTPHGLADDLDRIIRFYAARWKRSEVVLIGYSQGADVLPFALNRMPERTRAGIKLTALLGLGQKASFEFHVTNWIGPSGDIPIEPEARKLSAANTLCIYGTADRDSLCPALGPASATVIAMPGDHHFGGDYDGLATRILEAVPR